jgi:hypothetical protein
MRRYTRQLHGIPCFVELDNETYSAGTDPNADPRQPFVFISSFGSEEEALAALQDLLIKEGILST